MMKYKYKKTLKGEMYVDVIITIMIVSLVLALIITVTPVFIYKSNLNTYANKVMRVAELSGDTNSSEVISKISSIQSSTNIVPSSTSWSGTNYMSGTKVQLADEINLLVTGSYDIGFFTFGSFPVTMTGKATGSSEIYWK